MTGAPMRMPANFRAGDRGGSIPSGGIGRARAAAYALLDEHRAAPATASVRHEWNRVRPPSQGMARPTRLLAARSGARRPHDPTPPEFHRVWPGDTEPRDDPADKRDDGYSTATAECPDACRGLRSGLGR